MSVRGTYYLVGGLNWFATVLPMAVMVLLAQTRGFSLSQIGLYMGLYSLTIIALELPSGALADAAGRKRILLFAFALAAAAKLVFLFAFDLATLLAFAVLSGTSRALSSGALEAWFIDALQAEDPDVELQPALATGNTFHLLGLACGTLLGGVLPQLFDQLPATATTVLTPLSTTVVAAVIAQLLALGVCTVALREAPLGRPTAPSELFDAGGAAGSRSGSREQDSGSGARRPARWALRSGLRVVREVLADAYALTRYNRTLQLLLGADLIVGLVLTGSELLWQPFYAVHVGLGADDTMVLGVVLAGCFAMGMVGNLAATPLSRLLGKRYALVAGLFQLLQAASFGLLAWQTNLLLATACYWSTYVMRSAWSSPHAALFNREVPGKRRSVMLSVQSLVAFGGSFLGSVTLAPLAEVASIPVAWLVCGGLLTLTTLLYLALGRERARSAATVPT